MDFPSSPTPLKKVNTLTFPDAMREVINGKRIKRLEWGDTNDYGVLRDGFLRIYRENTEYIWQVNDGDMLGIDWVVIE